MRRNLLIEAGRRQYGLNSLKLGAKYKLAALILSSILVMGSTDARLTESMTNNRLRAEVSTRIF